MTTHQILELAIAFALALGAKDLVAGLLRMLRDALRKRYRSTPSTADDVWLEAAARLADLAALAAERGDLEKVRDLVKQAAVLPAPAVKSLAASAEPFPVSSSVGTQVVRRK